MNKRKVEEKKNSKNKRTLFLECNKKEKIEKLLNFICDIPYNLEKNVKEFFLLPSLSEGKNWNISLPNKDEKKGGEGKVEIKVKKEIKKEEVEEKKKKKEFEEKEKKKEEEEKERENIDFYFSLLECCSFCCQEQKNMNISNLDIIDYFLKNYKKYPTLSLLYTSLLDNPEKYLKYHLEEFLKKTLLLNIKKGLEEMKKEIEEELELINENI